MKIKAYKIKIMVFVTLLLTSIGLIAVQTKAQTNWQTVPALDRSGAWHVVEDSRVYAYFRFPWQYRKREQILFNNNGNRVHHYPEHQTDYRMNDTDASTFTETISYVDETDKNKVKTTQLTRTKHYTQLPGKYNNSLSYMKAQDVDIYNPDTSIYSNMVINIKYYENNQIRTIKIYEGPATFVRLEADSLQSLISTDPFYKAQGPHGYLIKIQDNQGYRTVFRSTDSDIYNYSSAYSHLSVYSYYIDRASVQIYWEETKNYQLTFNTNGGSSLTSMMFEENSIPIKPTDPYKDGYIFKGWYLNTGLTNQYNFDTILNANTILYAKWEQIPIDYVTVIFDTNGGTNVASQAIPNGTVINIPDNPTRNGYTFGGWFNDMNLSIPFETSTSILANTILYAKWNPIVYTVNLSTGERVDVNHGDFLRVENPKLENNTFVGWYYDAARTQRFDVGIPITSNLTLYAKFTPAIQRTVTFETFGGTEIAEIKLNNYQTLPFISNPTKEGYVFEGWYATATFTGEKYDMNTPITTDMTLYAKYVKNTQIDPDDNTTTPTPNPTPTPSDDDSFLEKYGLYLALILLVLIFIPKRKKGRW